MSEDLFHRKENLRQSSITLPHAGSNRRSKADLSFGPLTGLKGCPCMQLIYLKERSPVDVESGMGYSILNLLSLFARAIAFALLSAILSTLSTYLLK